MIIYVRPNTNKWYELTPFFKNATYHIEFPFEELKQYFLFDFVDLFFKPFLEQKEHPLVSLYYKSMVLYKFRYVIKKYVAFCKILSFLIDKEILEGFYTIEKEVDSMCKNIPHYMKIYEVIKKYREIGEVYRTSFLSSTFTMIISKNNPNTIFHIGESPVYPLSQSYVNRILIMFKNKLL